MVSCDETMMKCHVKEDTVGPPGVQRSVGGDGADRQHRHADDEIHQQEHEDGLVQSGVAHHEACTKHKTQTLSEEDFKKLNIISL